MLRAVIFDCFGVLTTDTWRLFIEGLPADADPESARRAHREYNCGAISKEECDKRIRAATGGHGFTELDDVAHASFTKNTRLLEYIHELHDQGLKIGILSNVASNWIREQLLDSAEQRWIDDFVFSYEVGMIKPDPKMYHLAGERLGLEPTDILFVDDKESYCQAARAVGMQAICYQDFSQVKAGIEAARTG